MQRDSKCLFARLPVFPSVCWSVTAAKWNNFWPRGRITANIFRVNLMPWAGSLDPGILGSGPDLKKSLFHQIYFFPGLWGNGLCHSFLERRGRGKKNVGSWKRDWKAGLAKILCWIHILQKKIFENYLVNHRVLLMRQCKCILELLFFLKKSFWGFSLFIWLTSRPFWSRPYKVLIGWNMTSDVYFKMT